MKTYREETAKLKAFRFSIYNDKVGNGYFLLVRAERRWSTFKMIMARVLRLTSISQINKLIIYIIDCNLYILINGLHNNKLYTGLESWCWLMDEAF